MTTRLRTLFGIFLWMPTLIFCGDSLFSSSQITSFPVAYKRIEAKTSLTLSQSLNTKFTIAPATQREKIDYFISEYPDVSASLMITDVVDSYPFELIEKYYLNPTYLGSIGMIQFRLTPSEKHLLQFTIPLYRYEPAVNRIVTQSPKYLSHSFSWPYKNLRKEDMP
ncbi:MAG: hypothetical protein J7K89_04295 [Candidatus Cloacimonetes bacterium]|nr:hypothetical protein [Candidatus Cloacimonadota bacterium]